jgi:hypothetical protein
MSETSRGPEVLKPVEQPYDVVQEDDVWMRDQLRHLYRHMPTQGQVCMYVCACALCKFVRMCACMMQV